MKEVTSQSTVVLSNVSISDKNIRCSCAELKMIVILSMYLQSGQVYRLMPHGNDRQYNCAMSNVFLSLLSLSNKYINLSISQKVCISRCSYIFVATSNCNYKYTMTPLWDKGRDCTNPICAHVL